MDKSRKESLISLKQSTRDLYEFQDKLHGANCTYEFGVKFAKNQHCASTGRLASRRQKGALIHQPFSVERGVAFDVKVNSHGVLFA